MMWDLEERVEDAFAAYLRPIVAGSMNVYTAFSAETIQLPCVVVGAVSSDPVSEPAEWHAPRQLRVEVQVGTEAVSEVDGVGLVIRTPRERNAAARSAVMDALAVSDLCAKLIAAGVRGVAFSMAQMSGGIERSIEDRRIVTTIPVDVIAEPEEV